MPSLWVIAAISVVAVLASYIAFRRSAAELDRRMAAFDSALEAGKAERDALWAAAEARSREWVAGRERWLAEVEQKLAGDADPLDEIEAVLDSIRDLVAEARRSGCRRPRGER